MLGLELSDITCDSDSTFLPTVMRWLDDAGSPVAPPQSYFAYTWNTFTPACNQPDAGQYGYALISN